MRITNDATLNVPVVETVSTAFSALTASRRDVAGSLIAAHPTVPLEVGTRAESAATVTCLPSGDPAAGAPMERLVVFPRVYVDVA
jgi:hypothetical protein